MTLKSCEMVTHPGLDCIKLLQFINYKSRNEARGVVWPNCIQALHKEPHLLSLVRKSVVASSRRSSSCRWPRSSALDRFRRQHLCSCWATTSCGNYIRVSWIE